MRSPETRAETALECFLNVLVIIGLVVGTVIAWVGVRNYEADREARERGMLGESP